MRLTEEVSDATVAGRLRVIALSLLDRSEASFLEAVADHIEGRDILGKVDRFIEPPPQRAKPTAGPVATPVGLPLDARGRVRWTPEADRILLDAVDGGGSFADVAARLGVDSPSAIQNRVYMLRNGPARKKRTNHIWTAEDDALIIGPRKRGDAAKLARKIGTTRAAINTRRFDLKRRPRKGTAHGPRSKPHQWTPEEDARVSEMIAAGGKTYVEIGRILRVKDTSVKNRVLYLKMRQRAPGAFTVRGKRRKRAHFTRADEARIMQGWANGQGVRELAHEFGVKRKTMRLKITRLLDAHTRPGPPPNGAAGGGSPDLEQAQ